MGFVAPEIVKEIKKMDLITYFQMCEPDELVKDCRTQYSTKTHSSLKMSNGYWHYMNGRIGGRNAVDYVERMLGYKFPESVEYILERLNGKKPICVPQEEKKKIQNLILPDKNTNENQVISYLKSRGIDEEIIQKCIQKHLIYEEKYYHNVVFVGYDEMGNAKYAGVRATNESKFKNDATGSSKQYSFRLESKIKSNEIYVFESSIDALSFATFFKLYGINWEEKNMLSLAGVYQPAGQMSASKVPIALQNYLEKHTEITKIYLCLDNDEAGRKATKALQMVIPNRYEVIDRPAKKGKDYNDYLCISLGIKREERKKKIEIGRIY